MAATETGIANAALVLLGEKTISSLDGNTKTANILQARFDDVRDETLRAHPWNFATQRKQIAADTEAPVWGYDYSYTLPPDCLRLLEIDNPAHYSYRVEGRNVVTDIPPTLNIEYTAQVTNVSDMDVMFRQALAAALAADVAEAITGSTTKVEQLNTIMQMKIRAARVPDGQEPSPRHVESSEWLDAREEVGFERRVPTGEGTPL